MMRAQRWGWLLGALLAAVGCGDSDEGGQSPGGSGGAGATGGSATGGTGGGSSGSGGTGAVATGGVGASGGSAGGAGQAGSAGQAGAGGSGGGAGGSGGTGGSGGNPGVEIEFDPTLLPLASASFPAGIQAGDPTSDKAMLWTRYAGAGTLLVRVFTPTSAGKALLFHESVATPSSDGFVHVDADGLPALADLSYVFLEQQGSTIVARSDIGRVVTAPLPGHKAVIRFGGTSCTSNSRAPFDALDKGGELNLDFIILAGDTTYNDSATTLAQYRAKWQEQIGEGTYQKFLQSTAHYATWDDHEVDNDWNPETFSPTRLAAARQTFFEYLPIRRAVSAPDRIWRSYRWGDTLEVFVLDSRGERKPSTRNTPSAEYLSNEQLAWLQAGLSASTATFKVIVNSVPITNFPGLFDLAQADRWEGYAAQRTKLLDYIATSAIKGVLFVSGDFHLGASATVEPSGAWSNLREVLMGPGDQNANPLWTTLPTSQFEFRTGTSNVTVFEANPNASPPTIKVTFVNGQGASLFDKTYSFP